jgi:predicted dehydrogenase
LRGAKIAIGKGESLNRIKVCFCGLGSIGKRHIRNLLEIAKTYDLSVEIHALRKTAGVLEDGIKDVITRQVDEEDKLDRDYDVAFITNPTNLHYGTIAAMAERTRHMFVEKPIFDSTDYDMSSLRLKQDGVYYVAGPLRYTGVIQTLKEVAVKEDIYCVRAICSSYLPDWRPGTDYRITYSARKAQGGGVALDLIHEWDYISYLFGLPQNVRRISGKYSRMEIDSEDIAVYIADYENKVVELHLDYFGRVPRREIELFTGTGTITGNLIDHTISFTDGRSAIHFREEKNDIYLKEMRYFIDHIVNKQPLNNLDACRSVLRLALGEGTL